MAEIKHTDDPMSPLPHVSNSRFRQAIKKYFYKDIEPEYTQYIEDLIINGSIESLDTLKELAEAIGNDPNFFGDVNARFNAVEETIEENEEITSAALNDLNTRTSTIEGKIPEIDEDIQDIQDNKEDKTDIVVESTAISTLTAEVGKYYRFDVSVETLAITLPTMTGVTSVKTITFYMTGGTTPGVTFTSTHDVHLADGFEIESGSTYEVNALWNGAAWIVASITIIVE